MMLDLDEGNAFRFQKVQQEELHPGGKRNYEFFLMENEIPGAAFLQKMAVQTGLVSSQKLNTVNTGAVDTTSSLDPAGAGPGGAGAGDMNKEKKYVKNL